MQTEAPKTGASFKGGQLTYIPALDGLRAIAALLVIAFHARWSAGLGGFVGVDVFFILSGFLITSALRRQSGPVDLTAFWARRAARLWPALLERFSPTLTHSQRF